MNAILSEVKGFTPVIDIVSTELGFVTAGVYGLVWRHCQMTDRVCNASAATLAEMLGVSTKTIRRHLDKLVAHGYIIDLTPDRLNAPHIYKDSGKVKIDGLIQAREVGQRVQPNADEVGQKVQAVGQRVQPRLVRESTEDTSEETIEETVHDGRAWFLAIAELWKVNLKVATALQKKRIGQSAKMLQKAGATPEQIIAFGLWWYETDWRGKKGNVPSPEEVREVWGQFTDSGAADGSPIIRLGK